MAAEKMRFFTLSPAEGSVDRLRDVLVRLAHALAHTSPAACRLQLPPTQSLKQALAAPAPSWAGVRAAAAFRALGSRIDWREDTRSARVLYWNKAAPGYHEAPEASRLDELCDPSAASRWIQLAAQLVDPDEWMLPLNTAHTLVAGLRAIPHEGVTLIGPGPSAAEISSQHLARQVVLIIGTAWEDRALNSWLEPDAVLISDIFAYAGPSKAAEDSHYLLEAAVERGARIVARYPLGRALAPLLSERARDRLWTLSVQGRRSAIRPLSETRGLVPDTPNVLTSLGLPIAAAVSERITLAGLDGSSRRNGSWEHADALSQSQRQTRLRLAHPHISARGPYYAEHRNTTAGALASLQASGYDISLLTAAGASPWSAGSTHSESRTGQARPSSRFAIVYRLTEALDRFALISAFAAGLVYAAALMAAHYLMDGRLMDGFMIFVAIFLLLAFNFACLFAAVLFLRKRQVRQIAELQQQLIIRNDELLSLLSERLERLESKAFPPDRDQP